jgi:hypothetical protein
MPIYTLVDDADDPGPIQYPGITLVDPDGGPYNPATSIPDGTYVQVPVGIADGEVPAWDEGTETWVRGVPGVVDFLAGDSVGIWYLDQFSGTDDAKIQTAIATWAASTTGGTIVLPARTLTMPSQWLIPNDGTESPNQKLLRFVGQGASHNGGGQAPLGGTIVDLTYNGAGVAKIDTRGHGLIEFIGITFRDLSGGNLPFFQTTNTTPHFYSCEFWGSKTGVNCDQDAIILGGGTRTIDGSATAKFDGYKPIVRDCYFGRIRRCIWCRPGCNDGLYDGNTIWTTCGSGSPLIGGIQLSGNAEGSIVGNVVSNNTLETSKYPYIIVVDDYAKGNFFLFNGMYDDTVVTLAAMHFAELAQYNTVIEGYSSSTFPYLVAEAGSVDTITHISFMASQVSRYVQPVEFVSNLGTGGMRVSGSAVFAGGSGKMTIQPAVAQSNNNVILWEAKRSAVEGTSPSGIIARLRQLGRWEAQGFELIDVAGASLARIRGGPGTPEAVVVGVPGDVWLRTDGGIGTTFYVKETGTGNTGWVATGSAASLSNVPSTTRTANYSATLSAIGTIQHMDLATANQVTLPPVSSVAWPVGTIIEARQVGLGQTAFVAGAGVTVVGANGLKAAKQWSLISAIMDSTDHWIVDGDSTQ